MSTTPPPLRRLRGTALGRLIDLRYPSNRLAVGGAALAGAVTLSIGLLRDGGPSFGDAVRMGIGIFLAWAITRELAPDHNGAAAAAMVLAAPLAAVAVPAAGMLVVTLLALRAWAGTVGNHPSLFDFIAAVGVAAYAGSDAERWIPALTLAAGLQWHSPHRRAAAVTGLAMAVVGVGSAAIAGSAEAPNLSPTEIAVLAAMALTLAWVLPIRSIASKTDVRSLPISPERVGAAWIAGAAAAIGAALFAEVASAGPILAAGAAAAAVLSVERRRPDRAH